MRMSSNRPEKAFWDWFVRAEQELLASPLTQESPALRQLQDALQEVDPDLTFELMMPAGQLPQLTISANGVRELIPVVDRLVKAKPKLETWKVTALRQRRELAGAILQSGDVVLATEQLSFTLALDLRRVDVTLYIENQATDQYYRWLETVFLLMDAAIGERDVALYVGEVFIKELEPNNKAEVRPFIELPEAFDAFLKSSKAQLAALDALALPLRRESTLEALKKRAQTSLENLKEAGQELLPSPEADTAVTVEIYYREADALTGAGLVKLLETSRNAVAEQIEFGSIKGSVNWVHAWFDVPFSSLETSDDLVEQLAQLGYSCNAELESIFFSWAEETADISNILANLETLGDAHAVLEAHHELENDNAARAVELLEEALEDDSENIEIRGLLAYSYAKLQDNDMAEACLEELKQDLEGDTEHPSLFWNMACAYALLAEAQEACESLRVAFALDPELRELAINDPDLSKLRGEPEFDELLYQA
jgi:tetratricopeptide (TPR) repeat protein